LPRTERADGGEAEGRSAIDPAGRGETILVVEDEAGVRQVATRALERAGYRVLGANSLAQAAAVTRSTSGPIDLLITDLILPDGSGGDVARLLTELRPQLRVLYVSGYTDDPELRRGISESEVEFLSKPFAPSGLVSRVREVLVRRG
jgi:DNA-binding response OmpR family regulator